ncbi:hypothetical protein CI102_12331 [Trichoderma harzianum]|uniref:Uncharacterized protein n=1 Tax=Trichoderma harzianum CBS 226.95 TaxID=983964 RepID=A0A2T4A6F6_TRIHA|nr:hypothetical protein M431DRAFT_466617 [Trichoderma harzianum CBS 226.95]PKK43504.1 hypothetical protein CI102_12331 [Trichoderma harzianum]PTB52598.1 hypothetical protein M431DRAFT_466617 [Trichoderma harzianum CBS 226.95]
MSAQSFRLYWLSHWPLVWHVVNSLAAYLIVGRPWCGTTKLNAERPSRLMIWRCPDLEWWRFYPCSSILRFLVAETPRPVDALFHFFPGKLTFFFPRWVFRIAKVST